MGFFSLKTSDTDRSISNTYSNRGTFTVYLLTPFGAKIKEDDYEGYGMFGGYDVYHLLALWNCREECEEKIKTINKEDITDELRNIGIDLAFSDNPVKYPIKIVENSNLNYEDVSESKDCPSQGYFY